MTKALNFSRALVAFALIVLQQRTRAARSPGALATHRDCRDGGRRGSRGHRQHG